MGWVFIGLDIGLSLGWVGFLYGLSIRNLVTYRILVIIVIILYYYTILTI